MAELLKNRYNYGSLHELALRIKSVYDIFQVNDFMSEVIDESWDKLELKKRMRKIAITLGRYLPNSYQHALNIIDKVIASYPDGFNDFTLMYFPDFVAVYGQDVQHWDLSMTALAKYTPYSSSEFAVRAFIKKDEKRMMQQMLLWTKHDNNHVRRLASEGCRPQLPWGETLSSFKKNPLPILSILEKLKVDSSLYVRKSVANNLNDISKTHPELVIKIATKWYGQNKDTNWIVKHGCRTLLKKGNKKVLDIFGFVNSDYVTVSNFTLQEAVVVIGENLTFSFNITAQKAAKIRLEYSIAFVKANGKQNRKIFQISELFLRENEKKIYTKKHSFAVIRTRKYYSGTHLLTLIVNGSEYKTLDFAVVFAK